MNTAAVELTAYTVRWKTTRNGGYNGSRLIYAENAAGAIVRGRELIARDQLLEESAIVIVSVTHQGAE